MIDWLQNIEFEHPWFFLLLGILPIAFYWKYIKKSAGEVFFPLPSLEGIQVKGNLKIWIYRLLPLLSLISFIALTIAMARPRLALKEELMKAEGIDIMMIIDLSSSMLSRDFSPNRLEASKKVAEEFIENRKYDRIGLTVFSGEAFTLCPLTNDHKVLTGFIDDIQAGLLVDGTALGNGLSSAVNRLKDSEAKSKVAILLTDGVNNKGYIEPETAIQIAKEFGVKVYTVGVGTNGLAQSPVAKNRRGEFVYDYVRVNIDEALLRQIARETGGLYFRATSKEELQAIYAQIDTLEKTEIEVNIFKRYSEEYGIFIWIGLLLFLLEVILRYSLFKTMPA